MFNAPRGHTSIAFCDKLKDNWKGFQELIAGRGFSSFNAYANNNFVEDLYTNYDKIVGGKNITKPDIMIDYHNDTTSAARRKIFSFSNGQILDEFNRLSDWRLFLTREMKKRGVKY